MILAKELVYAGKIWQRIAKLGQMVSVEPTPEPRAQAKAATKATVGAPVAKGARPGRGEEVVHRRQGRRPKRKEAAILNSAIPAYADNSSCKRALTAARFPGTNY